VGRSKGEEAFRPLPNELQPGACIELVTAGQNKIDCWLESFWCCISQRLQRFFICILHGTYICVRARVCACSSNSVLTSYVHKLQFQLSVQSLRHLVATSSQSACITCKRSRTDRAKRPWTYEVSKVSFSKERDAKNARRR
jgi:hypothetical protein